MNDSESPDVTITLDNLFDNDPGLLLRDTASLLEQDPQVIPVAVVLHHVDV